MNVAKLHLLIMTKCELLKKKGMYMEGNKKFLRYIMGQICFVDLCRE